MQEMLQPPPSSSQCSTTHDFTSTALTCVILVGLVISYLPQLIRIVRNGTSEGFSPWYLLLGATSSASAMLNILVVQWPIFQCCRVVSAGTCFESLLGFVQVFMQWFLFSGILILYLLYFPQHLKFQRILPLSGTPPHQYGALDHSTEASSRDETVEEHVHGTTRPVIAHIRTTPEWRLAVTVGVIVMLHVALLFLLSLTLLTSLPSTKPPHPLLRRLATFLGLSGTLLAIAQYAPQIYKTYRAKLVGALSLGTMGIQCPGSVVFILALAGREGVDWTSWLPYAVTAAMQGGLLAICLVWRERQKKLGIDDFGNKLDEEVTENDPLVR